MDYGNSSGPEPPLIEWASPFSSDAAECSLEDPAIYQSTSGSQHANEPLEPWQLGILLDNEKQKTAQLQAQVTELTEAVAVLQRENQALTEELNELHSESEIKEPEEVLVLRQRIVQAEAEIAKYIQYTRSLKRKLSKTNKSSQCTRQRCVQPMSYHTVNLETSHQRTASELIPQILDLLELDDASQILATVSTLKRPKKGEVLLHKLSNLMTQCTGYVEDPPSASQVWKWTRRVLEDLVKCERFLNKTQDMLGVDSHQDIEHGLAYVLAEGKQLRRLVSLMKEYFGLGADINDQEIEWLLIGNA